MRIVLMLSVSIMLAESLRADDPKKLNFFDDTYTKEVAERTGNELDKLADASPWKETYDEAKAKKLRTARYEFHRERLVTAFEKTKGSTAVWAAGAKSALEAQARHFAMHDRLQTPEHFAAGASAIRVQKAGCDDPLILSFTAWTGEVGKGLEDATQEDKYGELVMAGPYSPVHKMMIAADCLIRTSALPEETRAKAAETWRSRFLEQMQAATKLGNAIADAEVLFETYAFLKTASARNESLTDSHAAVRKAVEAGRGSDYLLHVLDGQYYVESAWEARGIGLAATVTEEGAALFRERLAKARTALELAWKADATRSEGPTKMIVVCMGQGSGREEMEQWYARAMTSDPDNYVAVRSKLEFLLPKWHGSIDEYYGSVWHVIRAGNWTGRIGMEATNHLLASRTVLDRDWMVQDRAVGPVLKDLRTWHVINTAFSRHLDAIPRDFIARSYYARFAAEAERFGLAHELFTFLKKDYASSKPFRTWERYDEMARMVASKAAKK